MKIAAVSAVTTALLASTTSAVTVFFSNKCSHKIELWDDHTAVSMDAGANHAQYLTNGFTGRFQAGRDQRATLAEFSNNGGAVWYDISIIPPGSGTCRSWDECKRISGGNGFNEAMSIAPRNAKLDSNCRAVTCMNDGCTDSYKYPADDTNTHSCAGNVDFDVVLSRRNRRHDDGTGDHDPDAHDDADADYDSYASDDSASSHEHYERYERYDRERRVEHSVSNDGATSDN